MATGGFAEGSFAHNMDQTFPHPSLRQERKDPGDERKGVRQIQTITQRDSSLRAILTVFPVERSRFRKA